MKRVPALLRDAWSLTYPYFRSEERWSALGLLGVLIALNLGSVYLEVLFNEWNNLMYTALQEKAWPEFWHQMMRFCWLALFFIVFAIVQIYLSRVLQIRWREWLTRRYLDAWLDRSAYYRIQLEFGTTDNPDQRIADDLRLFTSETLSLSLGLLSAVVTLASFVVILWGLSGDLSLALGGREIIVPGYMVWVALVYAIVGTWLTNLVGRRLIPLNFNQQRYEADFRFDLMRVRENADAIALDRGEENERRALLARFSAVASNWLAIMRAQVRLTWFTSGYQQIAIIFPFLVASPRYFSGAMQLGGLMQTASAFGQVQSALSFIINSYANLAEWTAVIRRLTQFRATTERMRSTEAAGIARQPWPKPEVALSDITIDLPTGPLLAVPHAEFPRGKATLISGPSGVGKSTLFRAIAGIWPYGVGTVQVPEGARLMFLPQRPYLPIGSLREVLLYPRAPAGTGDEQLRDALLACRLPDLVDRLDEERHWAQSLSAGEQQRLLFARALLQKPDWLFVDETTSALDEQTERALYQVLGARLPQTTIVSIGHRSSLRALHEVHLQVQPQGQGGRAMLVPDAAGAPLPAT